MGVVINSIIGFSSLIIGENQIERSKDKSRHAYGKVEANILKRQQYDGCENHGSHATRGSKRIVPWIVFVFKECRYIRYDNTNRIKQYVIDPTAISKDLLKHPFNNTAEKKQGQHIPQQV